MQTRPLFALRAKAQKIGQARKTPELGVMCHWKLMLNVDDIVDKGLERESLLTDHEQLIFAVAYLESLADMEGWDHFFTYNFNWYSKLIEALELSGDQLSLNVVNDYKDHFIKLGVPFQAKEIDEFLLIADEQYFENCIDWRESFNEVADQRWHKMQLYFHRLGFELST